MQAAPYIFLLSLALLICGCNEQEDRPNTTIGQEAPEQIQTQSSRNVDFGSGPYNQLWDRASLALEEGRLWTPAGDNAVEFYLQIKQGARLDEKNPSQARASRALNSALGDIAPILSLAIDEAIESRRLQEASRLIRMLAAIDSQAPSLARQIEKVRTIASPTKPE